MKRTYVAAALLCALCTMGAAAPSAQGPFHALAFRNIGPNSGRLDAAAGVPGDPSVYYVGGLGGLFKSTDGGASFSSIFNQPDVSSIGAIAVAPSNANVVYVGTGEPNIRNDIETGDGVWRSGDAGKTWQHVGLEGTAHIAQIAVDAHDPNVAYVAAEGPIYGSGSTRGIYKTTDGGKTWQHVLALDDRTGASSVVIDPADPSTVLAGMWTIWRKPWILNSGGPSDGLYISHDAGAHWARVAGHGFPTGLTGRIGLAFAPSNPSRIYALIESSQGVLWRSDDGAATWRLVNKNHALQQRPFYFSELSVDPSDQNHVYFLSVNLLVSRDGGKTTKSTTAGSDQNNYLGDNHQLWIDPTNARRMILADDDGAAISLDSGKDWTYPQIAISQAYHVDTDDRTPYTVCVEIQDAGSACGPSNSKAGGIANGNWFGTFGGESGWILFDPANSNIIYGSGYTGSLTRYDRSTHQFLSISPWPLDTIGWAARRLRYRFQWTAPIAVSPLEPRALYFGANVLFKSDDEGLHWHVISPDLTRNDKAKQLPTGGPITHDATSVETYDTIFTIAESPLRRGELWVGTDDGLVWLTRDDGGHWQNVTSHVPGMPAWARVASLTPSPFDAGSAYLAVDTHLLGDRTPHLYVTHDYGAHWRSIDGDLSDASYSDVVKEDPFRRGLLYAGTGNGLYLSFDDGGHWRRVHQGLPTVPVYDLAVQRRFDDLLVATHGRGIYILDDLHPIQQYRGDLRTLSLFTLRIAYRWEIGRVSYEEDTLLGTDPDNGALVNFWLPAAPAAHEYVTVRVYDGAQLVRTIPVTHAHAGVNRVVWNLRYAGFKPVKNSDPWRRGGFLGPRALPGIYRVTVTAAGVTRSGNVRVAADPQSHATIAALRAQFAFLTTIHRDLARVGATIIALRAVHSAAADAVLNRLYQPQATEGEDTLRYPIRIYEQLSSLSSEAGYGDAAPTAAQYRVLRYLETQMQAALAQARTVLHR
ncbi:MAG TPA: glycosyl hydrolase [Candidatus Dormibacteraeota bacterium]|nr:glycosyl hydrolase [Candidatus Dormibacteraeota bacterium]